MSTITTHVLDTAQGKPAVGVPVLLHVETAGGWLQVGRGMTDQDGRIRDLAAAADVKPGRYRLTFDTAAYLAHFASQAFFPEVAIVFDIHDAGQHYHVPLLLSPFGYSTYRGS